MGVLAEIFQKKKLARDTHPPFYHASNNEQKKRLVQYYLKQLPLPKGQAELQLNDQELDELMDVIPPNETSHAQLVFNPHSNTAYLANVNMVGKGGNGEVYKAFDLNLYQEVALKAVSSHTSQPEKVLQLKKEAQVQANISHPAIPRTYSFFQADNNKTGDHFANRSFFVMEFARTSSNSEFLNTLEGKISVDDTIFIVKQIAEAVDFMAKKNQRSILHLDLKPDNMFMKQNDDGTWQVKIIDFGISNGAAQYPRQDDMFLGTPEFMAPERATAEGSKNAPTLQAEVFTLALITYKLLTGKHLAQTNKENYKNRDEEARAIIINHLRKTLELIQGSQDLEVLANKRGANLVAIQNVFIRALSPVPQDRQETATRFVAELEKALQPVSSDLT